MTSMLQGLIVTFAFVSKLSQLLLTPTIKLAQTSPPPHSLQYTHI